MEAKHTPGPWTVAEHHGAIDVMGVGSGVCRVFTDPNQNSLPTMLGARANARLIAAAPDLLAALTDVAVHLAEMAKDNPRGQDAFVLEGVRAAIAKATEGRSAPASGEAEGGAR